MISAAKFTTANRGALRFGCSGCVVQYGVAAARPLLVRCLKTSTRPRRWRVGPCVSRKEGYVVLLHGHCHTTLQHHTTCALTFAQESASHRGLAVGHCTPLIETSTQGKASCVAADAVCCCSLSCSALLKADQAKAGSKPRSAKTPLQKEVLEASYQCKATHTRTRTHGWAGGRPLLPPALLISCPCTFLPACSE